MSNWAAAAIGFLAPVAGVAFVVVFEWLSRRVGHKPDQRMSAGWFHERRQRDRGDM